jgi:hypothetical protein
MLVGIYTRYHRCEQTLLAHRIADLVLGLGGDATFYTRDSSRPLRATMDARVVERDKMSFTDWVKPCTHVIWLDVPPMSQIKWVQGQGKKAILLPNAHELRASHRKCCEQADVLFCTNRYTVAALSDKWGLNNCLPICWDPGVPILEKTGPANAAALKLLYPLELISPVDQPSILFMLSKLLAATSASVTIPYLPSRVSSATRKFLDNLQDRLPEQVTLRKRVDFCEWPVLFASHDLTLWPSSTDHAALGALLSVYGGTPVLAFQVPPCNEFLGANNALLVPCKHKACSLGVPSARLDYRRFGECLNALVTAPGALLELYGSTNGLLRERREQFDSAWKHVLDC